MGVHIAVTVAQPGIPEVPVAMIAHRSAAALPTTYLLLAPPVTFGPFLAIHPHRNAPLTLNPSIQTANRITFLRAALNLWHYKRALAIDPLNMRQNPPPSVLPRVQFWLRPPVPRHLPHPGLHLKLSRCLLDLLKCLRGRSLISFRHHPL